MSERAVTEIGTLAHRAKELLAAMRDEPTSDSDLAEIGRRYTIKETAELTDRSPASIYRAQDEGRIPSPDKHQGSGRAKGYTLRQLNEIRQAFGSLPWRDNADEPVIAAVQNFKGGVGKSTVSVHFAQFLAQQGYRVLLIDADSQASATAAFGFNPDADFEADQTIRPIFMEGDAGLRSVILPTHWDGLDIVPANLTVYEAEYLLASVVGRDNTTLHRLRRAIKDVSHAYDVVLIDPPPALGMISLSVIAATNAIIIPCPPLTTDFASTATFLTMMQEVLSELDERGLGTDYKFIRFLMTKTDVNKAAQAALLDAITDVFGSRVVRTPLLTSVEYETASLDMRSIYEATDGRSRASYARARRNLDAVFAELEADIRESWPSHVSARLKAGHG